MFDIAALGEILIDFTMQGLTRRDSEFLLRIPEAPPQMWRRLSLS